MPLQSRPSASPADAAENRQRVRAAGVFMVNVVGGLGSGKTTLVRAALAYLAGRRRRVGVISAGPPAGYGREEAGACAYADAAAVLQVHTGTRPWLTAAQVGEALDLLPLDELDLLLVESVGSRTSAAPDLGQDVTVCVLSVVAAGNGGLAGHCRCDGGLHRLVVLNKIDLLPMVGFDRATFGRRRGGDGTALELFETSARTGEGVGELVDRLLAHAPARHAQAPPPEPGGAHARR
jgi:hydrogenase nickel incorporation protein HypB